MKKNLLILFLSLAFSTLFASPPRWVSTFGTETPYPVAEYLTGFAMVELDEGDVIIHAREISLTDLTGKIETKIYSQITLQESDGTEGYSSSSSMITRCTVDVSISGVEYNYYKDRSHIYALSYIPIKELSSFYRGNGRNIFLEIVSLKEKAKNYITSKRNDNALIELYRAKKNILDFYEQYTLYLSINSEDDALYFNGIDDLTGIDKFKNLEKSIDQILEEIEDLDSGTINEALNKAAHILNKQDIRAGNFEVPPFNFEQTSFSSEFGRYGSSILESALINNLQTSRDKTLFRSNYWLREDKIQLTILAINVDGMKLGQATVRFPYDSTLTKYNLKPQNFDESMTALREFAEGALTEGGIAIDIWTNKGRDADSPLFESGETLQLYMRVNQPAFLQISYHLATGEKVLLEKSYYLGMDKVNLTVKLPYDFEVQPPFGTEQLIVTAFSQEPPPPLVFPREINGERYEVFSSMNDVTAQTRGLAKKMRSSEIRVGEAILNLTTVDNLF